MTTEALGAEPSNARTLLRAVGLQAVYAKCPRKRHAEEEPKILIDTSRRRILLRSMVHVLPIVAAIGISYLNLTDKFVGHGFLNQYTPGDTAVLPSKSSPNACTSNLLGRPEAYTYAFGSIRFPLRTAVPPRKYPECRRICSHPRPIQPIVRHLGLLARACHR